MAYLIARRLVEGLVTLLLVATLIFVLGRATGDPTGLLVPIELGEEGRERVRAELGLDDPLPVQYGRFLTDLATGDLGDSVVTRRPVASLVWRRIPSSILLALTATALGLLIAIPLGVVAAVRKGTVWDALARGFALIGQAAPPFLLGMLLILFFAVRLRWLPAAGTGTLKHLVLPAVTLGWFVSAGVLRLLRSSLIEALESDFVRFAHSLGIRRWRVIWLWAVPNALVSVVTFVGFMVGIVIAGAVIVESIFVWPGLGRLAFEAILSRDFPLIQGAVLAWTVAVVVANLAADLAHRALDPRVRTS